jgi:hypothetical protein
LKLVFPIVPDNDRIAEVPVVERAKPREETHLMQVELAHKVIKHDMETRCQRDAGTVKNVR